MTLRFLQIFIPEDASQTLDKLLEGREVLGTWRDATANDRLVIHLLLPADETESLLDSLEQSLANADGFRVVLYPVEAVLPRPDDSNGQSLTAGKPQEATQDSLGDAGRISREELYNDIVETLGINRVFVAMTLLSSIVAAVGLMRDDVAVIIGAMVIAPLLGPNVAMSLSVTLGDSGLLRRALFTNIVGVALAFVVSLLAGAVLAVDPSIPAIAARTQLGFGDLALALAAGSAGTFAFTRGLAGAVIGVMMAVALMPPLVTLGMLLGSGNLVAAGGALLLLAANLVCVNLAGVATFLAQGVRPRTWWEDKRAKSASRLAIATWLTLLLALCAIIYCSQFANFLGQ